jgi:flagellar hook-associated protein 3 FlgL
MITRVADNTKLDVFTEAFSRLQKGLQEASNQITSGKKINKPSDDPSGAKLVLSLEGRGAAIDAYRENISSALMSLKSTVANLTAVDDFLTQAQGIAQNAMSASTDERAGMAEIIQDISDQVLSLANDKVGGRYLFSGSSAGVKPFVAGSTPSPPAPPYDYLGNGESMQLNVGKNLSEAYNLPGDVIFLGTGGGVDMFQTLQDLKTALLADDSSAIAAASGNFDGAGEQVQDAVQKAGIMSYNIETADSRLVDQRNSITTQIEGIENADVAEQAMELQMQSLALDVSYDAAFRTSQLSLLNFLK